MIYLSVTLTRQYKQNTVIGKSNQMSDAFPDSQPTELSFYTLHISIDWSEIRAWRLSLGEAGLCPAVSSTLKEVPDAVREGTFERTSFVFEISSINLRCGVSMAVEGGECRRRC